MLPMRDGTGQTTSEDLGNAESRNLDKKSDFRDLRPFRHLIRAMSGQKDKKTNGPKDVRAVSHSCDVFVVVCIFHFSVCSD